ncbi:methylthioribose ABC transporter ATP-binding protein [Bacillus cereus BAG1O-3]|uniref:sugar ABC transporter ATP-binding protein n=1 Tax=Bacillus TaxID=1386 RepID=UPI000352EBF8|nr:MULTISPECIES: sugar ABC transporter ATP-binding protein [Bacillus]EPF08458.1 methylthioribose ABC transporter ATP-binding protein [Bacillus cereus BAG1O-3]MDR4415281.1 sugar ABC transporter ATP-binding protein [Bacillus thuringiensis]PFG80476.1 monosaccharide ABC transporter ATP-binding protein, CUT2 family [Bacillus sp. YF23]
MMTFSLQNITHSYHVATPVLEDVSIHIQKGKVHALLGMNGAGKSTLLKIATGEIQPVVGDIKIDTQSVSFTSPRDAKKHGISFVTQEVDHGLIPGLSVLENVLIDHLAMQNKLLFSKSKLIALAKQHLQTVQVNLNVSEDVSNCSLHEKQLLLIARALSNNTNYLLLDEPTSSLGPKEVETFGKLLKDLTSKGIGILLVSHRLSEIRNFADDVTVLHNGQVALSETITTITDQQIVEAMTGKQLTLPINTAPKTGSEELFKVQELLLHEGHSPLSLTIRKGETVVIYGLIGSGKTTLAETLFGALHTYHAEIDGQKLTIKTPRDAIKAKIALVPEERRKQGVFLSEDIISHTNLHQSGWKRKQTELNDATTAISSFGISPNDPKAHIHSLSGGNQQKVSIAKWRGFKPNLFLLDEPTKGVDIAAKQDIFQFIRNITENGSSVIYFTGEQDEALHIADRILILANGEFVGEYLPSELSPEQLLHLSEGSYSIESRS